VLHGCKVHSIICFDPARDRTGLSEFATFSPELKAAAIFLLPTAGNVKGRIVSLLMAGAALLQIGTGSAATTEPMLLQPSAC